VVFLIDEIVETGGVLKKECEVNNLENYMLPYLQKVKDRHTPTSIIGNRNLTL
jgi:hypothetical protein